MVATSSSTSTSGGRINSDGSGRETTGMGAPATNLEEEVYLRTQTLNAICLSAKPNAIQLIQNYTDFAEGWRILYERYETKNPPGKENA